MTLSIAGVFCLTGVVYETCGTYFSMHKAPVVAIHDILFSLIPYKKTMRIGCMNVQSKAVGDILMAVVFFTGVISLLVMGTLRQFRYLLLLIGITGFFRPLTFCITHLSDPNPESPTNTGFLKEEALTFQRAVACTYDFVLNPFSFNTSGDMIFSGHTRFVMCGLCAFSSLVTASNASYMVPIFIVLVIFAVMAMCIFIRSRMHYSVDIVLAVFVTTSLWQILCQSSIIAASGVEENGLSLLARMWVSFCNWF
ncbi:hypothetical protein WA556_006114, partial [Blastocystis sp. ATCC 50177/Nand II]